MSETIDKTLHKAIVNLIDIKVEQSKLFSRVNVTQGDINAMNQKVAQAETDLHKEILSLTWVASAR